MISKLLYSDDVVSMHCYTYKFTEVKAAVGQTEKDDPMDIVIQTKLNKQASNVMNRSVELTMDCPDLHQY
jgi:C4-type Zn-finger protein